MSIIPKHAIYHAFLSMLSPSAQDKIVFAACSVRFSLLLGNMILTLQHVALPVLWHVKFDMPQHRQSSFFVQVFWSCGVVNLNAVEFSS